MKTIINKKIIIIASTIFVLLGIAIFLCMNNKKDVIPTFSKDMVIDYKSDVSPLTFIEKLDDKKIKVSKNDIKNKRIINDETIVTYKTDLNVNEKGKYKCEYIVDDESYNKIIEVKDISSPVVTNKDGSEVKEETEVYFKFTELKPINELNLQDYFTITDNSDVVPTIEFMSEQEITDFGSFKINAICKDDSNNETTFSFTLKLEKEEIQQAPEETTSSNSNNSSSSSSNSSKSNSSSNSNSSSSSSSSNNSNTNSNNSNSGTTNTTPTPSIGPEPAYGTIAYSNTCLRSGWWYDHLTVTWQYGSANGWVPISATKNGGAPKEIENYLYHCQPNDVGQEGETKITIVYVYLNGGRN